MLLIALGMIIGILSRLISNLSKSYCIRAKVIPLRKDMLATMADVITRKVEAPLSQHHFRKTPSGLLLKKERIHRLHHAIAILNDIL